MSLLDDFKARFPAPEFSVADADRLIPILEPSIPCYYGGEYAGCGVEIILNAVAHLMTGELAASKKTAQQEQSKSVGNVSTAYAPATASGGQRYDFWRTTKYGQRYLTLTQHNHGGVFV